jgi:hypothetical protein
VKKEIFTTEPRTTLPQGASAMSVKITDLIAYLLDKVPSAGRTQVVKFCYLADVEARKCLGKPLTNCNYVLYRHGPFDHEIINKLDWMDARGEVSTEEYSYRGNLAYAYRKNKKTPKVHFSPEREHILQHVAEIVRKNSLTELLRIVYDTEPVVDAKKRGPRPLLRMHLVDNERRIPGLEIERVLKSLNDQDEGRDMEEVFAELGV